MSRIYDALRKRDEQGSEIDPASVAKPVQASAQEIHQLLVVPSIEARLKPEDRIVVHSDRRGAGAERFRLICMSLRNSRAGKAPKILLITSPLPQDGKSTIALNLATSLSEGGKVKVLLLEADLHRPSLQSHLGLERMRGLTDVVEDLLEPAAALRRIDPLGFYLLPSGHPSENPTALLQSGGFHGLLRDFRACFEWILIDCPPALPLADVTALRSQADGVLLVARSGSTPREAIEEAVQLFKPGQVLGLILNAAEGVNRLYSSYYHRKDDASSSHRSDRSDKSGSAVPHALHLHHGS